MIVGLKQKNGICFKCLKSSSHLQNECRGPHFKFQSNHHTLLHSNKFNTSNDLQTSMSEKNHVTNTNETQDHESDS